MRAWYTKLAIRSSTAPGGRPGSRSLGTSPLMYSSLATIQSASGSPEMRIVVTWAARPSVSCSSRGPRLWATNSTRGYQAGSGPASRSAVSSDCCPGCHGAPTTNQRQSSSSPTRPWSSVWTGPPAAARSARNRSSRGPRSGSWGGCAGRAMRDGQATVSARASMTSEARCSPADSRMIPRACATGIAAR